jgi:hypothetical protein
MSHQYRAVGWNVHKRTYDLIAGAVAITIMAIVAGGTAWRMPTATAETLVLRATAVTALLMLHGLLSIGPLIAAWLGQRVAGRASVAARLRLPVLAEIDDLLSAGGVDTVAELDRLVRELEGERGLPALLRQYLG